MDILNPNTTPERLAAICAYATALLTGYAAGEKPEDLELASYLEQINHQTSEISKKELGG